ncbi:4-oxalocrotonate tautomerase family protein [Lysobacter sp. S4-A87]|uniref:tautomerase family protein n=1 Tax=Lysobacter sp. S4-A87 TaxID=2925843 RepID=UPI001F53A696|nr:4-oxalocrotonate tautomerase family protein [Lysobacter sp. S4-A87]UNK49886.1 4-oxalocrotonate tautomerase family protein [Lysobacter sp. S4-A87]
MPIVTIQITREGTGPGRDSATADEKAALIRGVSQLLLDVLYKPLDSTFVVIEEVTLENWGWYGMPVPELRRRRASDHPVSSEEAGLSQG